MANVVDRICNLPRDFRGGACSSLDLIEASGYFGDPGSITIEAVMDVLRQDSTLVEDWELWSMDKRCDGWSLQPENGEYIVANTISEGGRYLDDAFTHVGGKSIVQERLIFTDRVRACGEFVLREVQSIAALK